MGIFNKKKTIGDIEEESELAEAQINLKEKQLLIKEMTDRYGAGWQKLFKGKKFSSGIDWNAVRFTLKKSK